MKKRKMRKVSGGGVSFAGNVHASGASIKDASTDINEDRRIKINKNDEKDFTLGVKVAIPT